MISFTIYKTKHKLPHLSKGTATYDLQWLKVLNSKLRPLQAQKFCLPHGMKQPLLNFLQVTFIELNQTSMVPSSSCTVPSVLPYYLSYKTHLCIILEIIWHMFWWWNMVTNQYLDYKALYCQITLLFQKMNKSDVRKYFLFNFARFILMFNIKYAFRTSGEVFKDRLLRHKVRYEVIATLTT